MSRELCERWKDLVSSVATAACGQSMVVGGRRLRVMSLLAEGGFSSVYLVRDKSGETFAVKKILAQNQEQLRDAQWEIRVHRTVGNSNPNLIPLLGSEISSNAKLRRQKVLLLYPLFEGGSLVDQLLQYARDRKELSDRQAIDIFLQVAHGLQAFHSLDPPLAHRDVKPHNVLMGSGDSVVLMDFGSTSLARVDTSSRSSRLELQERASKQSSMAYRAPELWEPTEEDTVDERTDVWSMGCLLFAMLFGQGYSPFECSFASSHTQHVPDPFGTGVNSVSGFPMAVPRDCTYLAVIGSVPFPEAHSRPQPLVELIQMMLVHKRRPDLDSVIQRAKAVRDQHIAIF